MYKPTADPGGGLLPSLSGQARCPSLSSVTVLTAHVHSGLWPMPSTTHLMFSLSWALTICSEKAGPGSPSTGRVWVLENKPCYLGSSCPLQQRVRGPCPYPGDSHRMLPPVPSVPVCPAAQRGMLFVFICVFSGIWVVPVA